MAKSRLNTNTVGRDCPGLARLPWEYPPIPVAEAAVRDTPERVTDRTSHQGWHTGDQVRSGGPG